MGARFVQKCVCINPLFRITDMGQAVRCSECHACMTYESWDDKEPRNIFGEVISTIKIPTQGWVKDDSDAFNKWFDSPEY